MSSRYDSARLHSLHSRRNAAGLLMSTVQQVMTAVLGLVIYFRKETEKESLFFSAIITGAS